MNSKNYLFVAAFLLVANINHVQAAPKVSIPKYIPRDVAIYTPRPDYPLGARSRYEQGSGWFVMRIQIKSGRVKEVEVARSTGHSDLDASTVNALKRWRFKPDALPSIKKILPHRNDPFATEDALVKVPVSFELQDPTF